VSPALAAEVAFVTIQHVNADFPDAAGDNPTTIYKATDHDLPLLILNGQEAPATATSQPAATATATTAVTSTPAPVTTSQTEPASSGLWLLLLVGLGMGVVTAVFLFRRSK
jgi:hypothetical protein